MAQVKLESEDAQRMRRLSEEVQGRLGEMGLIASRVLGSKFEVDVIRRTAPAGRLKATAEAAGDDSVLAATNDGTIYIELVDQPGGTVACVIHCPPPASEVVIENPCGSGPLPCF